MIHAELLAARVVARILMRWAKDSADVAPSAENAWQRGAADTSRLANDRAIRFSIYCAGPGAAIAGLAAVLASGASAPVQVLAATVGGVAGILVAIAGLTLFHVAVAPVRQRDEARAALAQQNTATAETPRLSFGRAEIPPAPQVLRSELVGGAKLIHWTGRVLRVPVTNAHGAGVACQVYARLRFMPTDRPEPTLWPTDAQAE